MNRLLAALILFPGFAWAQSAPPDSTTSVTTAAVEASDKFGSPCPYPDAALRAGLNGSTFVSYRVTPDGRVVEVTAIGGSHNADLDRAAQQCVSQWRVAPDNNDVTASVGIHRATIAWKIPPAAESTVARPAGYFTLGMPHDCNAWYPPVAIRKKISGTVTVQFLITTDGAVKDPKVIRSSGNDALDDSALRCVPHWRYLPAKQNGQPVEINWQATIKFGAP
jgi:TonB family protein